MSDKLLNKLGLNGGDAGFPFPTTTAEGRTRNFEVVQGWVRRGWISRPANWSNEPEPRVPKKHAWTNGCSPYGATMVATGRALAEPFHRQHLRAAAKCGASKASNTLTAWREAGWIVGGAHEGWTRTSAFGEEGK